MWAPEMDHTSVASFVSPILETFVHMIMFFFRYSQSIGQHEEKSYEAVHTHSNQDKPKCIAKKIQKLTNCINMLLCLLNLINNEMF